MPATTTIDLITQIYAFTSLGVCIMLAAAGLGSALGWGMIAARYMEGVARQPELMPTLRIQLFITGGLMESFPFIVLAFAMWFVFANPFMGSAQAVMPGGAG
jgi:F-type H+-transporting ATPase subunit c